MPSPPRPRFNANAVTEDSEGAFDAAAPPTEDVDYGVPAEDAGAAAEYTLPPPDPTVLPPVLVDGQTEYGLPESVPNPGTPAFAIHPTLAILTTDGFIIGASAIADAELRLPATSPETKSVVVHGEGLPWPLRIAPTRDSPCVTVGDVVESMQAFLCGAATDEDFANAPNPNAVTHAFHERTRGNRDLYKAGTIRFDYLPGPIVGLVAITSKDDAAFKLVFRARS
ncbi:unnamed protein product [Peniophora sp. CBMAI 1063]|nr:unnamed protein product [Peniophora sp. CBMAI 1063]